MQRFSLYRQMTFSASLYQISVIFHHFLIYYFLATYKSYTHSPTQPYTHALTEQQWDAQVINAGVRSTDKPILFYNPVVNIFWEKVWVLFHDKDAEFCAVQAGVYQYSEREHCWEQKHANISECRYKILGLVGWHFLRCSWLLGLPQVAMDGNGIYTGRHGLSWDLAKLLPVRIVLE